MITDLQCEHCINPLGIETPTPRLSWRIETDRRGARQTAYRIVVASSPAHLAAGQADLWDSGRVASDACVLVPYAGRRLRSRQQCWWHVHVWDERSEESVSTPASWEMGLLKAGDWKAQWITGDTPKKYHDVAASPILRRSFRLDKPVASARAYVCGLGFYELYLNGEKVGDAVVHPAFTRYDARALYTVHDVTHCLTTGENVAGVMLGTGWYNHHVQDVWKLHAAPWCDECKALVQIEIAFTDGSRQTIVSNCDWQFSTGPIVFDGLRNGEIYDAREEKPGWNAPGYATEGWQPVRIARPPGGVLRAQIMPPCRVTATLRPVAVTEISPGVWVYNLGRNIAGWARLSVQGPAGTTVSLRYAERIGPDGAIDQSNIKTLISTDVFQTDTYILKGEGVETYETRFTYHGFQYVEVTGLPGAATLEMLAGRVVHTDFAHTGAFSCSNELLNAIQAATIASTIGNYHGMPTDCPHREKNGWTGDAQLSAEQVLYNFAAAAAYTKWLDDFPDVQRVSGALPGFLPSGGWGYNWGAGPAWDSAYIMIPWYLYLYRGDRDILRRHYAGMRKCLDFMASLATDHIVEFGLGDWCPPSPGPGSHKCPAALTNTAYYYADTRIVARIAELLGKRSDARRLTALAAKIKAAARRHFYDRKTGRVAGHSQTSLACFLFQGLVEPDEIPAFTQMLLDEVAAYNDHIDCGILGTKYVMNVLTETGHADVAYRIATQRDFPSWGHWLAQGATTLWENWDGAHSRNHHMFSDISAWFYKTLAGIVADPAHPGFKHIIIKPWPVGDLTHAEGSVMTPYGRVRSAWRRTPECFTLDVIVPPNSRATVYLPTTDAASVCESGRAVTSVDTVVYRGCIDGRAAFEFGAGTYCFTLACQPAACCNQFADSR